MDYEVFCQELFILRQAGINPSLENIRILLESFDHPEEQLKCIHVAGTNGKGSVCAMLSSILQKAGYKTGLYTSPHLVDMRERVLINSKMMSQEQFMQYAKRVQKKAEEKNLDITFFELITCLAFLYFQEQHIDYAVIETGLGGTWDATNVITPLVSVITHIGLDHADFLGDTLISVATEKAGIIKEHIPVITTPENNGVVLSLLKEKALEKNTDLALVQPYGGIISLQGDFQQYNAGLADATARELGIEEEHINQGIAHASWSGRCQFIDDNILIDGAHNPQGMEALRSYVNSIRDLYPSITIIFGVNNNKDYQKMLSLLPSHDLFIATRSSHSKSLDPGELGQGIVIPDVAEAIKSAKELSPKALIVICGSLYLIGDVMKLTNNIQWEEK